MTHPKPDAVATSKVTPDAAAARDAAAAPGATPDAAAAPDAVVASRVTPDAGEADLTGYGRLPWDQLRAMIGECPAAWADYDGFHIRPAPPDDPPPYSHLWAWTDKWLIRARIDGAHAITGALILTAESPAAPLAKLRERVAYQRARSENWPPGEKRVGPLTPDVAGRPVTLYLIPGAQPVTFIAVDPQP